MANRSGLPRVTRAACAAPHEVILVKATLDERFVAELPERLIGDRAYDSNALNAELAAQGIEMIAPNHSNRRVKSQDGRSLRRCRRRWKIERPFACLQKVRRIAMRYEYHLTNYLGVVHLSCALILLRRCL